MVSLRCLITLDHTFTILIFPAWEDDEALVEFSAIAPPKKNVKTKICKLVSLVFHAGWVFLCVIAMMWHYATHKRNAKSWNTGRNRATHTYRIHTYVHTCILYISLPFYTDETLARRTNGAVRSSALNAGVAWAGAGKWWPSTIQGRLSSVLWITETSHCEAGLFSSWSLSYGIKFVV